MKNGKFEEYFEKYKGLIIKVIMDKTSDYQLAQEICQKVFMNFYMNMNRISPDFVKAWLVRCANNAVIDHMRGAQMRREFVADITILEAGNSLMEKSVELYQERMYDRELAGRIMREVRAVNENWYEILMMCCVEGLSYTEASERLGVSEPVLRARMYRARVFIKERFGDEYKNR